MSFKCSNAVLSEVMNMAASEMRKTQKYPAIMCKLPEEVCVHSRWGILFINSHRYDSEEQFFGMNSDQVVRNLLGMTEVEATA